MVVIGDHGTGKATLMGRLMYMVSEQLTMLLSLNFTARWSPYVCDWRVAEGRGQ
jgi:GTPase SAR1 family protein